MQIHFHSFLRSYLPREPIFLAMTVYLEVYLYKQKPFNISLKGMLEKQRSSVIQYQISASCLSDKRGDSATEHVYAFSHRLRERT